MRSKINLVVFCCFLFSFFVPLRAQESLDQIRQQFVDKINQYRASLNDPNVKPLTRWVDGEQCADTSAKVDADKGMMHYWYNNPGPGCPIKGAQNTLPGYSSFEQALGFGLQSMWNEGPPPNGTCLLPNGNYDLECYQKHGHYIAMSDPNNTKVAVGIYRMPDNKIWINFNFFNKNM
jgi:hypothetical protein